MQNMDRYVIKDFYTKDCKEYTYTHVPVFDRKGDLVEVKYKIAKGKSSLYTLNMYNTKCSCLVNGKQPHQFTETDLPNMLTKLHKQLQLCDTTIEDVNENVVNLLQRCQHELIQSGSTKSGNTNGAKETVKDSVTLMKMIPESSTEIRQPETTQFDGDFDDDFNDMISNDMLVKEAKVDALIETIQQLHSSISSMKADLSAHITTTSSQFEIINDQLHSIKIQNKVNAKTTNDQIECIEKNSAENEYKISEQT